MADEFFLNIIIAIVVSSSLTYTSSEIYEIDKQ